MKELFHFINRCGPLSTELKERLEVVMKYYEYPKGSYLLSAGRVCKRIWFLQKGITRTFIRTERDEITTWFNLPLTVIYALNSFVETTASGENIQALEDCEVWYITREDAIELAGKFPDAAVLHSMLYGDYVKQIKSHSVMKGYVSLEERFRWLRTWFPDVIYGVDSEQAASFIGVSRRSFFELKKRFGKG